MSSISLETLDGIAVMTLAVTDNAMNVLSPMVVSEMSDALESMTSSSDAQGILLASGKSDFAAGWDLTDLLGMLDARLSAQEALESCRDYSRFLRRLETCGKPVAAAINGLALGGGLELALASHYRVLADDPKAVLGLPEVKVGLLPGAGGTQRLPRLIGVEKALPLLLDGTHIAPQHALRLGIVNELAPAEQVVARARQWLKTAVEAISKPEEYQLAGAARSASKAPRAVVQARAPWDREGFRVPGGSSLFVPAVGMKFMTESARIMSRTLNNFPAPKAILSAVYEGIQLPIDRALAVESRYFASLITGTPVARNLVRTMFVNKSRADKLTRRPATPPPTAVRKLGILGAGMMGAGIAHVSALAGIDCVLLDRARDLAERGKKHTADLLVKDVEKGVLTQLRADAVLERIKPTVAYRDLANCDLVIEAVFEERDLKALVMRQAEAVVQQTTVLASNTSTLPISSLGSGTARPAQFIGIHFFSPVHRMPLVEVIVGDKTCEDTLSRTLDYVRQLRKTPIVVKDSRGFYTSRVFGTYCYEGHRMLEEGVDPALIENAGRFAGMPVGPLAVTDEVSLELQYKVIRQSQVDLGAQYRNPIGWNVLRHFVEDLNRLGRKSGGGFYEYPHNGKKFLWPGLAGEYPRLARQPDLEELKTRLLYIQAIETLRCLEEGVLESAAEADLGSVLGWGFPAFTGGTLSFIDGIGADTFAEDCRGLAERHGPRFEPPRRLIERAKSGDTFHPRAPWPTRRQA